MTAGFGARAAAAVRRVAWDLAEDHSVLQPMEVTCALGVDDSSAASLPGIALIHRTEPILLVVLDELCYVCLDTELMAGDPRARFEAVQQYAKYLGASGYAQVFDHQTNGTEPLEAALPRLAADFARRAGSRRFDDLRYDFRLGVLFGAPVIAGTDYAFRVFVGPPRALLTSALFGLLVGLAISAFQYVQDRSVLAERVRQLRDEIVSGRTTAARLIFRHKRGWFWLQASMTAAIGVFVLLGLIARHWPAAALFLVFLFVGGAEIWRGRRGYVVVDEHGVEALTVWGRARIAYAEIDEIRARTWSTTLTVTSSDTTIQISRHLRDYLHLLDLLWERSTKTARAGQSWAEEAADTAAQIRARLTQARGWRRRLARASRPAWRPLWMWLRGWRHPLRQQYRWQRHLLARGHVAWGYIVTANEALYERPSADAFDAAALVVFEHPVQPPGGVDQLLHLVNGEDSEQRERLADFLQGVLDKTPVPVGVPVPANVVARSTLRCTSLMIVRRHLPLGHLCSPWLPLLVDPERCPFVILVPRQYWGMELRRRWKAGPGPGSSSTGR